MADLAKLAESIQSQEFDSVWTVRGDNALPCRDMYAPEVWSDDDGDHVSGAGWHYVTHGLTGQYGYSGPVMHPSECVGTGIADRIDYLSTDYLAFCIVAVDTLDGESVGWAIVGYQPE